MGISASFRKPRAPAEADHGVVFRDDAAFCGWPFYCGLWALPGGEVLAGFKRIPSTYGAAAEISHTRLTVGQGRLVTIRSADGGARFDPGSLNVVFDLGTSAEQILRTGGDNYDGEPPLDFLDRNVIVMSGAMPALLKPDSRAWLRASADGGRTWRRPILLPLDGLSSLTGHGPPTVRAGRRRLLGLSTTSADGWTNRPLVYASTDGGTLELPLLHHAADRGRLGRQRPRASPSSSARIRHFYTRPLALRDGRILASLRFQRDATRRSSGPTSSRARTAARTWRFLSRVNDWGAPGDIVEMARRPHRLRLRLSPRAVRHPRPRQRGRRPQLGLASSILRDDGGSWDLGYPRVIEAAPGRLLTVYYMNRKRRSDPDERRRPPHRTDALRARLIVPHRREVACIDKGHERLIWPLPLAGLLATGPSSAPAAAQTPIRPARSR